MRRKISPPPDHLLCAPCREVILWPEIERLVFEFAATVRGQKIEHLITVETSGQLRRASGTSHSVSNPRRVSSLVFFEIHNHPKPRNQADAFLHPADLASSFLGPSRCYSTAAVLLQVPSLEHIIASRLKPRELKKMLAADNSPLIQLHEKIQLLYQTSGGLRFQRLVLKTQTILELAHVFKAEFPMLDFEVFELDHKTRTLKLRTLECEA